MVINHRVTRWIFALAFGLSMSWCSYQWIGDDAERRQERAIEESVVLESREILRAYVAGGGQIEISDALDRVREAGKVYIFPRESGWELSGQYRRNGERGWHAYLMLLDENMMLENLAVRDDAPELLERAAEDPRLEITPGR
jgi:hypothetical protein